MILISTSDVLWLDDWASHPRISRRAQAQGLTLIRLVVKPLNIDAPKRRYAMHDSRPEFATTPQN